MAAVLDLFSRPPGLVRRAEYAPEFDDEDEKILDNVWEQMRKEMIDGR